jgi:hypothetical protein
MRSDTAVVHDPQRSVRGRHRRHIAIAAVTVAGVVALVLVETTLFPSPAMVSRITVRNDTGFDVHLSLVDDDGATMPLGTVAQHCVSTFVDVIDQGDVWHVAVRSQGRSAAPVTIDRTALNAAGWTFVVPTPAGGQLRAAGAPSPPSRSCATDT